MHHSHQSYQAVLRGSEVALQILDRLKTRPGKLWPAPHCLLHFLFFCRQYSSKIKKAFSVRYDPFTCSIEVLDKPQKVKNALNQMRDELKNLCFALEKLSWAERHLHGQKYIVKMCLVNHVLYSFKQFYFVLRSSTAATDDSINCNSLEEQQNIDEWTLYT